MLHIVVLDTREQYITKQKEKITYHLRGAGYLADQANIKQTKPKKKKRYNNVHIIAIYIFVYYCFN